MHKLKQTIQNRIEKLTQQAKKDGLTLVQIYELLTEAKALEWVLQQIKVEE